MIFHAYEETSISFMHHDVEGQGGNEFLVEFSLFAFGCLENLGQ